MKALVLGGNGFIGSHLVDRLIASGDDIRVLDRIMEKHRPPHSEVEYFMGTFSDVSLLAEALSDVDIVYHLASTTLPSTSNLDPIKDVQDNLVGTLLLLDTMIKASIKRIVFLSSGGTIYGNPDHTPTSELHPLRPRCSYGVVKAAIEHYLFMYQQLYELQPLIIRPSNPYGPRQGHTGVQGIISTFLYKLSDGEPFTIWGDGRIVRDYIYIDDLAELICTAGRSAHSGAYNAGSGIGLSVNKIVEIISRVTDLKPCVEYKAGRLFDIEEIALDITKTTADFNWSPKIDIINGIKRHWQWIVEGSGKGKMEKI